MKIIRQTIPLLLLSLCSIAQQKQDSKRIDITSHPRGMQVMAPQYIEKLGRQDAQFEGVNRRLDVIESALKEHGDMLKELTATNTIINFFIAIAKLLIPGVLIATFSIWFARRLNAQQSTAKPA